jgi:hypothetical protein
MLNVKVTKERERNALFSLVHSHHSREKSV